MVSNIIANIHLLNFAVLGEFNKHILEKRVKVFLDLRVREVAVGVVRRVDKHVGQENRLRESWSDMFSRAAVSVSASSDFEVETRERKVNVVWKRPEESAARSTLQPVLELAKPRTCS